MELRRWFQLFCILPALQDFLVFRVYSQQCPGTHYLTKQLKCCLKCPAGHKVEKDCQGDSKKPICTPCEEGFFQATQNGKRWCQRCDRQIKSEYREVEQNCTSLTNKKYGNCTDGYYLNLSLDACRKCRSCPKGFGVKKECLARSDTECETKQCAVGTYSDQDSFTQKCAQCTPCKKGEEMSAECNAFQNFKCIPKATTIATTEVIRTATTRNVKSLQSSRPDDSSPTDAPREPDGRSWVMPFFVAAMVLLLILFVAFVIGVTVWCKIQSRNAPQNVIVQAEDPQIVQRFTKLANNDESVRLVNEESRFLYHELSERKPRGAIRENGMMLRDVSHDIIEKLANFLNPTSPPSNWRKVASMLDFPWNVINNLALCPTTATQQLLERWGTKRDATVYKLYVILKDIGRDDAAEVLERLLLQPVPSCPKSI